MTESNQPLITREEELVLRQEARRLALELIGSKSGSETEAIILSTLREVKSGKEEQERAQALEEPEAVSDSVEVLGQKSLSLVLDTIEQRANAATPGPWKVSNYRPFSIIQRDPNESTYERGDNTFLPFIHFPTGAFDEKRSDSAFVVASRSDVPRLVKALRRAVEAITVYIRRGIIIERQANALSEIAKLLSESPPPGKPESRKDLEVKETDVSASHASSAATKPTDEIP